MHTYHEVYINYHNLVHITFSFGRDKTPDIICKQGKLIVQFQNILLAQSFVLMYYCVFLLFQNVQTYV